jgi:hypothetical protein
LYFSKSGLGRRRGGSVPVMGLRPSLRSTRASRFCRGA